MPEIRKILCPVDFSAPSEQALRYAIGLAERFGASVKLLHVYQIPTYALPDGALLARPDFLAELTTELQKQMDGLIERYRARNVPLEGEVLEGLAFQEIDRVAEQDHADLIVMGTHGRSGLKHMLLGSVAERVVRISKVPVLTVRGEAS